MEVKLQARINELPVIHKAHIYEPKIEDVAEISFKAGQISENQRLLLYLQRLAKSNTGVSLAETLELIEASKPS